MRNAFFGIMYANLIRFRIWSLRNYNPSDTRPRVRSAIRHARTPGRFPSRRDSTVAASCALFIITTSRRVFDVTASRRRNALTGSAGVTNAM